MNMQEEPEMPDLPDCPSCGRPDARPNYEGRCEDCYLAGLSSISKETGIRNQGPKVLGARQDANQRGASSPTYHMRGG